jgi:hypothetical protein
MRISLDVSQKLLATLWLFGAGIPFLIIFLQTILGRYGDDVSEAWGWLLPNTVPTISLIIGVLVTDAFNGDKKPQTVDKFIFRLALVVSIVYLVALTLTLLAQPFSPFKALELMKLSNLWLAPLQGVVSAALGAFFVQRKTEEK